MRLVDVADLNTINEDGIAVTVNIWALDVLVPGLDTVTESVPTEAISDAVTVAVN